MALLLLSAAFEGTAAAYPILLLATACLGIGFGLTVPALNTLTAAFNPTKVDPSILVLNALLGVGTVLAPVLVAIFVGLGFWWGLPVTSTILLAMILVVSVRLPLDAGVGSPGSAPRQEKTRIPSRFWIFAAFAVLYGICETMNGNWAQVDMTSELGASTTEAALALTAFWGMVTVGRVGFAFLRRWIPERWAYHVLPFLLSAVFVLIALLPSGEPGLGILAFGLAGLGCSALLPLTISFGQKDLVVMSAAVAGGVIAAYQLGYGSPRSVPAPSSTTAWASRRSTGRRRPLPRPWASCRSSSPEDGSDNGLGASTRREDRTSTAPREHHFSSLAARATTRPRTAREMAACTVIANFANGARGIASVGLNAVALVNPRYR
jgi:fucose permease